MKKRKSNTCIAIIKNTNGKVLVAADRRVSWDDGQYQTMSFPKVYKRDGLILAATGDGFLCELFTKHMPIPKQKEDQDVDSYIYKTLYEQILYTLAEYQFVDEHGNLNIPTDVNVEIIVVLKHRVFSIDIDDPAEGTHTFPTGLVSITENSVPYAVGCGGHLAWGALLAYNKINGFKIRMSAKTRLTLALQVASDVSNGCDSNIDIICED